MMMWKVDLDPFITPLPTLSPAFLPVYLKIPGFSPSIHVALYLPTSGKDSEFVSALSQLGLFLEEVAATHQCPVYIRGDANCNPRNLPRISLLEHFCSKHSFVSVQFDHPSHHHFTGDGLYDAQLDVLLHQADAPPEQLSDIVCKLTHPLVDSAHDIILSSCHLKALAETSNDASENIKAIKITNDRIKIKWDEMKGPLYQELVSDQLQRIREIVGLTVLLSLLFPSSISQPMISSRPAQLPPTSL